MSRTPFTCRRRLPWATSPATATNATCCARIPRPCKSARCSRKKPPLRILAPGRVFRRDSVDATHSANFHQVEGLCVDKRVTVVDLKAALDYLVRGLFGSGAQNPPAPVVLPVHGAKLRNGFHLARPRQTFGQVARARRLRRGGPEVFKAVGLNPDEWSGYAFGFGLERIAMVRSGLDDIRHFYQNDLRFLRQFA